MSLKETLTRVHQGVHYNIVYNVEKRKQPSYSSLSNSRISCNVLDDVEYHAAITKSKVQPQINSP